MSLPACNHAIVCYDVQPTLGPAGEVYLALRCLLCGVGYDRRGYLKRLRNAIRERHRLPAFPGWDAEDLS